MVMEIGSKSQMYWNLHPVNKKHFLMVNYNKFILSKFYLSLPEALPPKVRKKYEYMPEVSINRILQATFYVRKSTFLWKTYSEVKEDLVNLVFFRSIWNSHTNSHQGLQIFIMIALFVCLCVYPSFSVTCYL